MCLIHMAMAWYPMYEFSLQLTAKKWIKNCTRYVAQTDHSVPHHPLTTPHAHVPPHQLLPASGQPACTPPRNCLALLRHVGASPALLCHVGASPHAPTSLQPRTNMPSQPTTTFPHLFSQSSHPPYLLMRLPSCVPCWAAICLPPPTGRTPLLTSQLLPSWLGL